MEQLLDSNLDNETRQYTQYASFGQRLVALIIDAIIVGVVQSVVGGIFGFGMMSRLDPESLEDGIPATFYIFYLFVLAINVAYYGILESSEKQATFGKQAMGIIVTNTRGERLSLLNAIGRYFAKIPSAMILLIGYLMQPFTEKKQALHDIIAGTLVYKK